MIFSNPGISGPEGILCCLTLFNRRLTEAREEAMVAEQALEPTRFQVSWLWRCLIELQVAPL